ncbi:MAG: DNA cytosine methyltransferase, partial [Enterococcus sp.]|nr:DNA cytosine methyltransferase [Enterococcus sp.]
MAVLSHYLHGSYDLTDDNKREIIGCIKDYLAAKQEKSVELAECEDWNDDQFITLACDDAAQYGLFDDFFKVPFPAPKNPKFTFIDLFAGIGGFRIAMQKLGGKCVYSSEFDAKAQETYFANYGEMPFGDITKEGTKKYIPEQFDVLCAGFPCQPFSISGKQKGFEDTRGTLFFDVCQIVQEHQPKVIFLENVKHLMHHDSGNTLKTILSKLEGLGYFVSWKILNGADYGVPQNRERIIIIGSKNKAFDFNALKTQPRGVLKEILDKDGKFEYLNPEEYTLLPTTKCQPLSGLIFAGYRNKSIRKVGVRPGTEHLSRVHKQPNRIYSAEGIHPTLPSQETSGRFFIL